MPELRFDNLVTKTCLKCGQRKPFEQFRKRSKSKDGHTSQCKDCLKVQISKRWQREQEIFRTLHTTCASCRQSTHVKDMVLRGGKLGSYCKPCQATITSFGRWLSQARVLGRMDYETACQFAANSTIDDKKAKILILKELCKNPSFSLPTPANSNLPIGNNNSFEHNNLHEN